MDAKNTGNRTLDERNHLDSLNKSGLRVLVIHNLTIEKMINNDTPSAAVDEIRKVANDRSEWGGKFVNPCKRVLFTSDDDDYDDEKYLNIIF